MRLAEALLVVLLAAPLLAGGPLAATESESPLPDRTYALVMRGTTFNLERWPSTPMLEAFLGERLRFVVAVPPGAEPHTFHLHGHPWLAEGGYADARFLRPGDALTFEVRAGLGQHAGDWMYHCHMDAHQRIGMWGVLRVYPFAVDVAGPLAALTVRLDRVGEPLEGARFAATLDGEPVPVSATGRGEGSYVVALALPPLAHGDLELRARHALGESVARLALDGAGGYVLVRDVGPTR